MSACYIGRTLIIPAESPWKVWNEVWLERTICSTSMTLSNHDPPCYLPYQTKLKYPYSYHPQAINKKPKPFQKTPVKPPPPMTRRCHDSPPSRLSPHAMTEPSVFSAAKAPSVLWICCTFVNWSCERRLFFKNTLPGFNWKELLGNP